MVWNVFFVVVVVFNRDRVKKNREHCRGLLKEAVLFVHIHVM